ncbi:hypothetical protein [Haloarcula amylovorans]|uniref:hypothetical protein n=1 Tax=Haloarcula amylovorans TaxID=2562280 RepID=UPI001076B50A|nr:hypothetical protein [Halomicroarcula amylolytica]
MTDEVDDLEALRVNTETGDRLDAVKQDDVSSGEENPEDDKEQETVSEPAASDTTSETKDEEDSSDPTSTDEGVPSGTLQNNHPSSGEVDEKLLTALDAALDDLEGNDRALHIWDGNLAAVVTVLDSKPEWRKQVISEIDARTQADVDIDSQSEFLSHLLRVGLDEVAPEAMDALRETKKQRALRKL